MITTKTLKKGDILTFHTRTHKILNHKVTVVSGEHTRYSAGTLYILVDWYTELDGQAYQHHKNESLMIKDVNKWLLNGWNNVELIPKTPPLTVDETLFKL